MHFQVPENVRDDTRRRIIDLPLPTHGMSQCRWPNRKVWKKRGDRESDHRCEGLTWFNLEVARLRKPVAAVVPISLLEFGSQLCKLSAEIFLPRCECGQTISCKEGIQQTETKYNKIPKPTWKIYWIFFPSNFTNGNHERSWIPIEDFKHNVWKCYAATRAFKVVTVSCKDLVARYDATVSLLLTWKSWKMHIACNSFASLQGAT